MIRVALDMKIQSKSLTNLVERIKMEIHKIQGTQKFELYKPLLQESCHINFSKAPIFNLIMEIKLIFWMDSARALLAKKMFTMKELEDMREGSLGANINSKEYLTV